MTGDRDTKMGINKGSNAYILEYKQDDAPKKTYVMKSFSLIKYPDQTLETLKTPPPSMPPGWSYRWKTLTQDLELTPNDGKAELVCDSKGNCYDLTGPGYSNYVP
jgi:hypothetical protein